MTDLTARHDGGCPPCRRDIALLRGLNTRRVPHAGATACPSDCRVASA